MLQRMSDIEQEEQRKRRAAARAGWAVRVGTLDERAEDDLSATTTLQERLAMVWRLTLDAWASSGQSIPSYSRSEAPGRMTTLQND